MRKKSFQLVLTSSRLCRPPMAFMATYDEEATDPVIEAPATPVFEADSRSGSRLAVSPERKDFQIKIRLQIYSFFN